MSKKLIILGQSLAKDQVAQLEAAVSKYEKENPGVSYRRNMVVEVGEGTTVTGHYSRRQHNNDFSVVAISSVESAEQAESSNDTAKPGTGSSDKKLTKLQQAVKDGVVEKRGPWFVYQGRKTNRKSTFLSWFPQFND